MKIQNPRLNELFKTPKRKTYTLVGISTLLVGAFILLSLRPTFIKINDIRREIKDKEIFLERLDSKLEKMNYLINQRQSVIEELAYFEEDFPIDIKGGFIVANLAAIASEVDVDLMSVEFEEVDDEEISFDTEGGEYVIPLVIKLSIEGNRQNIEDYTEYLEAFPRIFDIKSLSYSQADFSRFEGELEDYKPFRCGIEIYAYYWGGEEL